MTARRQYRVFWTLLWANVVLAAGTYFVFPTEMLRGGQSTPQQVADIPTWQLALGNGAIVLVVYGLLGWAGIFFARKLDLPGTYRKGAGWWEWAYYPLIVGLSLGVLMSALDRAFASFGAGSLSTHPAFPLSLVASATAGIGEEIVFRLFLLGFLAVVLDLLLWRWASTGTLLSAANLLSALAFGAAHLPAATVLAGVASPGDLPIPVLTEIFVLNGLVAIVAGDRYIKEGLVAAVGIHFWADVVWHVVLPLLGV
ncbi:MAG TPA: CPBP family glutamic-type intramembrane protease [Chloroflexota bacterium]|nr:CPBP family glutamic-type intramembrane protease [Chloroflexota bacterium]